MEQILILTFFSSTIFFRYWQRTVLRCQLTLLFIIVCPMQPFRLQMWKMRTTQLVCWPKQHFETQWAHVIYTKFWVNVKPFREQCRLISAVNQINSIEFSCRTTIYWYFQVQLDEVTEAWGIKVERVEM